ncbi:MAG: hypothetical protein ACLPZM_07985 [Thermoplasmata archaeon]
MNPKRRKWILVAVVAAVGVVTVSLVLLALPISQESSGYQLLNGRLYFFQSESLFGKAAWQNYSYRGVTFGFHLWCAITPAAGEVCGNATESGGVSHPYSFSDGPPQPNPSWQSWVAPDSHEAVEYTLGGLVHLLVSA